MDSCKSKTVFAIIKFHGNKKRAFCEKTVVNRFLMCYNADNYEQCKLS